MTPKIWPAAILLAMLCGCATAPRMQTVDSVNLEKYAGTWHEVARIPNWFQRNCVSGTTANYKALPDGTIQVTNSCRKADGKMESIVGSATPVPGSNNTKLKVRFFGPFAGDYWIIGLDKPPYQWALVGHPSRKYLWILSRTPTLDEATYQRILKLAAAQGYDTSKIVRSKP